MLPLCFLLLGRHGAVGTTSVNSVPQQQQASSKHLRLERELEGQVHAPSSALPNGITVGESAATSSRAPAESDKTDAAPVLAKPLPHQSKTAVLSPASQQRLVEISASGLVTPFDPAQPEHTGGISGTSNKPPDLPKKPQEGAPASTLAAVEPAKTLVPLSETGIPPSVSGLGDMQAAVQTKDAPANLADAIQKEKANALKADKKLVLQAKMDLTDNANGPPRLQQGNSAPPQNNAPPIGPSTPGGNYAGPPKNTVSMTPKRGTAAPKERGTMTKPVPSAQNAKPQNTSIKVASQRAAAGAASRAKTVKKAPIKKAPVINNTGAKKPPTTTGTRALLPATKGGPKKPAKSTFGEERPINIWQKALEKKFTPSQQKSVPPTASAAAGKMSTKSRGTAVPNTLKSVINGLPEHLI